MPGLRSTEVTPAMHAHPARGLSGPALIRRLAATWPGAVALVLLALAAYLPGLRALPPVEFDESRYAEAAREMAASRRLDRWIIPTIEGRPRLNKPPLVYWLVAGSAWLCSGGDVDRFSYPRATRPELEARRTVTGSPPTREQLLTGGIWAYRLPAVVASILAVLLTWRLGLTMFSPPCAWLAAALLCCAWIMTIDARLVRTDQVLLACTLAAQWALWNLWRTPAPPRRWVVILWLAIGLGVLTKGPVTPGVVGLTVVALSLLTRDTHWVRRLHWPTGLLIAAAVVLPWLVAALAAVGPETFVRIVTQEVVGRSLTPSGGRAGPPGYHLVVLHGAFWPGALLAVPAFIYALRAAVRHTPPDPPDPHRPPRRPDRTGLWSRIRPGRPAELFCLAWIVPAWLLLELIETKLPHYPLPLYPAVALLCARAAWAGRRGRLPIAGTRAALGGDLLWWLIGLVLAIGLPVRFALRGDLRREPGVIVALVTCGVLVPVILTAAFGLIRRRRFVSGLMLSLLPAVIGARAMFQTVLPNLRAPWLASRIVRELAEIDPSDTRPKAAVGYTREGLVFLTGGRVRRIGLAQLPAWLHAHPRGLVIIPADIPLEHPLHPLAEVAGFDPVEGRPLTLLICEPAPTQTSHRDQAPSTGIQRPHRPKPTAYQHLAPVPQRSRLSRRVQRDTLIPP